MRDSDIHRDLRGKKKKKSSPLKKILVFFAIVFAVLFLGAAAGFAGAVWGGLPDVSKNITPDASSQIFDRKGRLISTIYAEEDRLPVTIDQVPKDLQNAFIAAEDIRFYEHQAVLAIEIENEYPKDKILEMYMNQIYFGQGCYGIQTASKVYFGKDVKDLNLAQCALLAGLPNSPNYYSPFRSVEAAKSRQAVVLDQMAKYGFITEEEAAAAKQADLELAKPDGEGTSATASYFVSYVVQALSDKYDSEAIYREGLKIYTTLDLDMQKAAEAAVKQDLPEGAKDENGLTQPQGALLALEAETGDVLAMVGGRGEDHFNRAVQMVRQPGSSFKPFTYVTALEKGKTLYSKIDNKRETFAGGWTPNHHPRGQRRIQRCEPGGLHRRPHAGRFPLGYGESVQRICQ